MNKKCKIKKLLSVQEYKYWLRNRVEKKVLGANWAEEYVNLMGQDVNARRMGSK